MSKFGWSYPPGCSGPPDEGRDPIPEEEEIQNILEAHDEFAAVTIDRIMEIVAGLVDQINQDCPRCEEAAMKQEMECEIAGAEWDREKYADTAKQ